LNYVFELARVTYGPHPVPGTDEFTEAVRKRKLDAAGKNLSKRLKAMGKKKMEATKVAPSWGKASLKRPSATEVASARPLKQSKKTMAHPVAAATTTRVPAGALSSNVAAGASGSKGMTSAKKTTMPIFKYHVPAIGAKAAVISKESQKPSPHGRATWDSTAKIASRSGPRGQSSWASLPGSVLRLEPEVPLQITTPLDIGGASILDVTAAIATG
jgi:hypothetical protein